MSKHKIEIIVGTYEAFLLGYKLETKNEQYCLTQSFADKSHSGSLRCLAVEGKWIATGSTDDRIFVYDMKSRKQSQIILTHEGSINSLAFTPDETHLLSAADDGHMIATRLNTWFTEANWKKAHGGVAVTHVCCHPSGKLALSLGSDRILRTWNLVKGRVAYKTNLKNRTALGMMPECMTWSASGDYFTLSGPRVVEFWSIKTADVICSKTTKSKPICLCWVTEEQCLVGLENGTIMWISVQGDEDEIIVTEAHNSRVKAMSFLKDQLVSAASSGEIKLWNVLTSKRKLKEIAVTNIGCRPTCLVLLDLEQFGEDYVLHKSITEKSEEKIMPKQQITTPPPRGKVTIEYEDNNEHSADEEQKSDNEEDSEDSVREDDVSDDESKDDNMDENEDDDIDLESANCTDEDVDEDAPQIRLPKSRKRKQQILQSQAKETKKQKINIQTHNKKQLKKNGKFKQKLNRKAK